VIGKRKSWRTARASYLLLHSVEQFIRAGSVARTYFLMATRRSLWPIFEKWGMHRRFIKHRIYGKDL
jgi:hypothetical protein